MTVTVNYIATNQQCRD